MQIYDAIGHGYRGPRREDPRIGERIRAAIGDAARVVNVGAGTGSYEPGDRAVFAVEPSRVMIEQRPAEAAPAVQARAGALPFCDDAFDAALAVLTIHHWPDLRRGLDEMRRVATERVVLLTCDPGLAGFWLLDYFPEIERIDREAMPALDELERLLGSCAIEPMPVPHDCADGFLGAYWRRPHAYLEAGLRSAISIFSKLGALAEGIDALRRDLESGAWVSRYGELLDREELDLGYRLVVAEAR
jgi:SAM-dependent methyltransferase